MFPKILLIGCVQLETFILLITEVDNLEPDSCLTFFKSCCLASRPHTNPIRSCLYQTESTQAASCQKLQCCIFHYWFNCMLSIIQKLFFLRKRRSILLVLQPADHYTKHISRWHNASCTKPFFQFDGAVMQQIRAKPGIV